MRNTTIFMMMGLGGLAFTTVMGYMTGGIMGAMAGMLGGIISFIAVVQLILIAKTKGFLPFYWNLEEENNMKKEKYTIVPNKFGNLRVIVAKMVADGVIFIKRFGLIDDKGTEYSFGKSPLSFVIPTLGYTKNIRSSQYHHLLREKLNIIDFDDAVKEYLGEQRYKTFRSKFRANPEPDAKDIELEIQWLMDIKDPAKTMIFTIAGETFSFHDDLEFFKYNYHPQQMKVFVENEKINVRREEQGYKDPSKAMAWGKAAFIIILAIIIFIAVLSMLDLSSLGSFFGMGGHNVVPHAVNNTTVVP